MSELDPERDLVRALNEQADLPTRMNTTKRTGRKASGGSKNIGPNETIAADNFCWCGEGDHDWPGKSEGAPHPR